MILSEEQRRAISADRNLGSYEWIDLPVGPQPLPEWCNGLHVNWMEGFGNSPSVTLKTSCDPFEWEGKCWVLENDAYYRAYSDDGRLEQHFHSGQLSWNDEKSVWQTTQQDGYAGRHFQITMCDGRKIVLRGPWFGGHPAGYTCVSVFDTSKPYNQQRLRRPDRPWFKGTACFGLTISDDLLARLIARYEPTCKLARVTYCGVTTTDPVRWDWDEPKQWMNLKKRAALAKARGEAS